MINSSRPSASVFPPPHLIITRNAHGAEEAEGLGTRLAICTYEIRRGEAKAMRRRKKQESELHKKSDDARAGGAERTSSMMPRSYHGPATIGVGKETCYSSFREIYAMPVYV